MLQVKIKDMCSSEILRFKFNRWLSRTKDDGATLRELPATPHDGAQALPGLIKLNQTLISQLLVFKLRLIIYSPRIANAQQARSAQFPAIV